MIPSFHYVIRSFLSSAQPTFESEARRNSLVAFPQRNVTMDALDDINILTDAALIDKEKVRVR